MGPPRGLRPRGGGVGGAKASAACLNSADLFLLHTNYTFYVISYLLFILTENWD